MEYKTGLHIVAELSGIFGIFYFGSIKPDSVVLTILVPLLAMPQLTHYIMDVISESSKRTT